MPVRGLCVTGDALFTCASDKFVKVWRADGELSIVCQLDLATVPCAAPAAVCLHKSGTKVLVQTTGAELYELSALDDKGEAPSDEPPEEGAEKPEGATPVGTVLNGGALVKGPSGYGVTTLAAAGGKFLTLGADGQQCVSVRESLDLVEVADRAQLPMPKVAIVPDATPNAFATGRDPQRAVVAVTEGLLRLTDQRELRGVIAHELAHIKHRDTLIATIAAAAAAAITSIAQVLQWSALFGGLSSDDEEGSSGVGVLLTAVLAPIGAVMIQAGISRSREYIADEYAAELTADPKGLANALAKLQRYGQQLMQRGAPMPQPATTSLSIVNPLSGLSGRGAGIANLFSTHPPIEQRIQRLMAMA